jgi:DNA-binding Lrp family transcriptional regulator
VGRVKEEANVEIDSKILTILSMNGRATLDFIGKHVGLSKHPTYRRIKRLEENYGIKYIAEIDVSKFGYLGYMAFVKFRDKIPTLIDIHKVLEKEPRIQLVLLTSGEYDLIIYFLSDDPRDVAYFIFKLRGEGILASYPSDWYLTPHYTANFIPLRDEFFELLKKSIWHRSKTTKRPTSKDLLEREYILLKELNKNGSASFTDIDEKYKLGKGASRYTYYKLKERGILRRMTISMQNLSVKYHVIFFTSSFYGTKFSKTRPNLLMEIIRDGPVINKYIQISEVGIPAGVMLVMPVFSDIDLKNTEDYIKNKVKWITFKKLIVTGIPIGSFCYRRFDNTYTNQYKILVEDYKILKYGERVNYDEDIKNKKQDVTKMALNEISKSDNTEIL